MNQKVLRKALNAEIPAICLVHRPRPISLHRNNHRRQHLESPNDVYLSLVVVDAPFADALIIFIE